MQPASHNHRLKPAFEKSLVTFVMIAILLVLVSPADAQRKRPSFIRDAEIEALIMDYAGPLMRAAGLRRGSVDFHLVSDPAFNAFVSGRGLFVNTGLILQAETPGEVIGVIAHEIGHIKGGHQIRLRQRLESAAQIARVTSLLGLGIGVAGAAGGSNNAASAGLAIASGGPTIALRGLLKYQREEESAADRTAATLLRKTKQSGKGMLRTFKRLASDLSLLGGRIDPYTISHPLPNVRIANMENLLRESPYFDKAAPKSLQIRHDMARAKIAAYVGGDQYSRALLSGKQLLPPARLYGRAITSFLYGSPTKALPMIDKLISQQPKNAYVHEMKGEILLRSGQPAKAIAPFRRAIKLDKTKAGFIHVELGHALVQSGNRKNLDEAIVQLKKGIAKDPQAFAGYQQLAIAYGMKDDQPNALLASAELAVRTGKKGLARQYARRAQQAFKRGSPPWLRAEDIINYK